MVEDQEEAVCVPVADIKRRISLESRASRNNAQSVEREW